MAVFFWEGHREQNGEARRHEKINQKEVPLRCYSLFFVGHRADNPVCAVLESSTAGKSRKMSTQTGLAMYMYSGVPIVRLEGEWDEASDRLLTETVRRLAFAGHCEIIINCSQASHALLLESGILHSLERLAASVRTRCGRLDVVGTVEQIQTYLRQQANSLLRWATSEEEALSHIKGIPIVTPGPKIATHLVRL